LNDIVPVQNGKAVIIPYNAPASTVVSARTLMQKLEPHHKKMMPSGVTLSDNGFFNGGAGTNIPFHLTGIGQMKNSGK